MNGYKRCKCRDENGRELGARCPRLRRRDGSWNPGHGTWYGKAELPTAPDGQRIMLRQGGFPTQDKLTEWFDAALLLLGIPEDGPDGHEARMEIRDLVTESRRLKAALPSYDDIRRRYAEGAAFRPGTTGDYLLSWIESHRQAGDWAPTTVHSYDRAVRRLFLPVLGDRPLDKLRSADVLRVLARIDAENDRIVSARASEDPDVRRSVAGLRTAGVSSKRRYIAVLSSALAEAMAPENRLVTTNVAAGIRVGKGGRKGRIRARLWTAEREQAWRREYENRVAGYGERPTAAQRFAAWRKTAARPGPVMIWTPQHLGRFLDHACDDRLYPAWCIIAYNALRRGEACGLRWTETDLETGHVDITSQIVQVGWQPVAGQPKTDASIAWVELDKLTAGALRAWRKAQRAERLSYGRGWADTGLVFTQPDGTAWHPAQMTARFERLAYAAGLPPIRLHDLRHCAATIALSGGADITKVSRMLRHASVQITSDIYTEVLPELAAEVSAKVVAMVPRAKRDRGAV